MSTPTPDVSLREKATLDLEQMPVGHSGYPRRVVRSTLAFFASCIRGGEQYDAVCERAYDRAMNAVETLEEQATAKHPNDLRAANDRLRANNNALNARALIAEGKLAALLSRVERAEAEQEIALRAAVAEAVKLTVEACDKDEREDIPLEARVLDYAGILAAAQKAAVSAIREAHRLIALTTNLPRLHPHE